MDLLSKRINSLPISATLSMAAKARELKNNGVDIIGLSLGEPDFNTPEFIKDAAINAVNDNWNSYSPVDGYLDLKAAICNKFKRDNGISYESSQIVVSTGAKQSIANVCMVLLNPGDEVLLPAPYWVSYSAIATLAEAESKIIPTSIDTDFKITPEQLENSINSKTKLVMFNSPNNPSGTIYTENELRALGKVLEKYPNIYILSDEIYEHINYGTPHFSIASIPELYERTITVNGVAKAFAMTGWRIGYIGAPEWIAKACNKMQGQITSGANCIAQRATIAAVNAPVSQIQYMVDEFSKRREIIIDLLKAIPGRDSRFSFDFPRRISRIQTSLFSLRLWIIFLCTPFEDVFLVIPAIVTSRSFAVMSNISSWLSHNSLIEKVFAISKCVCVLIRTSFITWASVPRVSHVPLYLRPTNVATGASMRISPIL